MLQIPSIRLEAGVDEVARGPLFGPVFAAAVILNPDIPLHPWLNDSKKVTKKRRKLVREWIEETALCYSVADISNEIIDKINIRNAAFLAMEIAIRNLSISPIKLLIDGDYFPGTINFGKFEQFVPNSTPHVQTICPHICIVGGDGIYASIAAASILAKEYHDEYIKNLLEQNPELCEKYSLETNMGYGTNNHIKGLKEHGASSFHRRTFLSKILPNIEQTYHHILVPDKDEDDILVNEKIIDQK